MTGRVATTERRSALIREALTAPYARVLRQDEEGRWDAEVLELRGCLASGDTAAEALANLDAAMEDWLDAAIEDGEDLPEPMASREYSGRIALRILPSMHRRIAELASAQGVSMNRWLSDAIATSARIHREAAE